MIKSSPNSTSGFTIIEVMVAVFLLSVGAVGVYSLVNQAMQSASILSSRLIAIYLAQEGLEVARNIRDGNWLEMQDGLLCPNGNPPPPEIPVEWADGLPFSPPKDRRVDYIAGTTDRCDGLPAQQTIELIKVDGQGFYSYGPGTATRFTRVVHIERPETGPNIWREIRVTVSWTERGRTHNTVAQEVIYDWR